MSGTDEEILVGMPGDNKIYLTVLLKCVVPANRDSSRKAKS